MSEHKHGETRVTAQAGMPVGGPNNAGGVVILTRRAILVAVLSSLPFRALTTGARNGQ